MNFIKSELMKSIENIAFWFCMLVGAAFFLVPVVDAFRHPELTEMQILIKHWRDLVAGTLVFGCVFYISLQDGDPNV